MSEDLFHTIELPSNGIFKDKGSKFLSFAYPVSTESEIKDILINLRKTYYDARHFCYAYRLGADKNKFRDSDDGEPANTAGKPIMRQLTSKNLTNILIVVIRYFGGTLLGVGGLIKAYGNAASDALNNSKVITKTESYSIMLNFKYAFNKIVQKIIKEEKLEITQQKFEHDCSLILTVRKSEAQRIIDRFKQIENLKTQIVMNDEIVPANCKLSNNFK